MLEIRLFGALRLVWQGQTFPLAGLPKSGPLLAYLLLNRLHAVDREHLAYTLWPDVSESQAKANLRRHIYDLQNALPPAPTATPWLLRTARTVQWNPQALYWLDLARFESLDESPEHLDAAVNLYTADLLAYLDEEWLNYERGRLRALYLDKVQALVGHYTGTGRYERALALVEQILRADPLHERSVQEALKLNTYLGDRAGALRTFQDFRELLHEELALTPLPETLQLAAQIAEEALPLPAKPLAHPPAPPPAQTISGGLPRSNVPAPVRPLIGREKELAHLQQLLTARPGGPRLITLTGMAGVGKSRLALEVAHLLSRQESTNFADGIYFIPLASLAEPEQVLPAIAAGLEVPPPPDGDYRGALVEWLRYRRVLLVLDNLEHLLAAAPALGELLPAIPELRLLVTSQALLNLYSEQGYAVQPLVAPELADRLSLHHLAALPAVALFCQAAELADAHFRLTGENAQIIANICTRLEGLPLALELAAAHTRMLSPQTILAQLTDRLAFLSRRDVGVPARQRSLLAALEWSYNLLDEADRELFRRLAIFADGFAPEAVAAVMYARPPAASGQMDWAVMEKLARLLDRNLIRRVEFGPMEGKSRFSMLTTLREFALEKLKDDPALPGLRSRFAEFLAGQTEAHSQEERSAEGPDPMRWFQMEEANLRDALAWSLAPEADAHRFGVGLRILLASDGFWTYHLRFAEARSWIDLALPRREQASPQQQTRLLDLAGHFYGLCGAEPEAIFRLHEDALALARQLNEPALLSKVLDGYGKTANEAQNFELSGQLWQEAIAISRSQLPGMARELANLLNNLSNCYKWTQRYPEAIACLEECLAILQSRGLTESLVAVHINLSTTARLAGNLEMDAQHLRHCLTLMHTAANQNHKIVFLSSAAERALVMQDYPTSAILHAAMQSICQQVNMAWPPYYQREFASYVATTRQHLDPEHFNRLWNLGARLSLNQAIQRVADWLGMDEGE